MERNGEQEVKDERQVQSFIVEAEREKPLKKNPGL